MRVILPLTEVGIGMFFHCIWLLVSRKLQRSYRWTFVKFGEYIPGSYWRDYEILEVIQNMFWISVVRKCRHTHKCSLTLTVESLACKTMLGLSSWVCCPVLPSVLWHYWLGGRKGIQPVKNWVVWCWCGYLSGARCRLAYDPANSTATHCLLLQ